MSTQTPTPYRPETRPTPTPTNDPPSTHESWVAQCQRQFDPHRANRLKNLVDEEHAGRYTV